MILIIIRIPTLSIICSNVTRLHCVSEIPALTGLSGNNIRPVSIPEQRSDHCASITPPAFPIRFAQFSQACLYQPLIHRRKLSVLALSVSAKTFWAGGVKITIIFQEIIVHGQAMPGSVPGWFIASGGIAQHPDTDIREAHHSILRAFTIMFCTGDWGRVFTWHNVYIIQTRILPPSCQHCWNLQRLLDPSETTLFHLRPLVMPSWQGEVGWHGQAVLILLPVNSVMHQVLR